MAITIETDVVVIGAGITAAMFVERLAETTDAAITVLEAGDRIFNLNERYAERDRFLTYGENPWPGDHIEGQSAEGILSRSMSVGGLAMHWGGVTPRFTPGGFPRPLALRRRLRLAVHLRRARPLVPGSRRAHGRRR